MRISFFLILLLPISILAQQNPRVEYAGGVNALNRLLSKLAVGPDIDAWGDHGAAIHTSIEFTLDAAGHMSKEIFHSDSQIDTIAGIFLFIKAISGHWINHTDHAMTVILPIYFIHEERGEHKPTFRIDYSGWRGKDIVVLDPLIAVYSETLH